MDLNFTAEELAFREEIRDWVAKNLPKETSHKVHNALRLGRDDQQGWGKILGKKGWLAYNSPKEFGGPGWNSVQNHLFEQECARAGAPRAGHPRNEPRASRARCVREPCGVRRQQARVLGHGVSVPPPELR